MQWRSDLQPSMRPRRQDLWRKLIEATMASIAERGYPATTVGHITDAAGVNRTQFYFLFQDKDECFLAAQEAVYAEIEQRIRESGAGGAESWQERIHLAIDAVLELFDEQPSIARVAVLDSSMAGPTAQAKHAEARERLAPHIAEGAVIAPDGASLPDTVADMALGSAAALLEKELHADGGPSFMTLAPDIYFAILLPFAGPAEAAGLAAETYSEVSRTRRSRGPTFARGDRSQPFASSGEAERTRPA